MKKKTRVIILTIFIFIILFIIGGIIQAYRLLEDTLPETSGRQVITTIKDPVEITFDVKGIPQIWAQNAHDAYFAMGYQQAADRLFQMDMTRKVAEGRLAGLLGKAVLKIDLQQRTIGHNRIARKYLKKLSPKNRSRLQAYTDGVNSYIATAKTLPFEFLLLRKQPEPWSVYDCLAILSFQTWFSNFLISSDEFMARVSTKLDSVKIRSLNIPYPVWAPRVVPAQKKIAASDYSFKAVLARQLFSGDVLPFRMANSSNSWVVAPQKSASGSAMLASDPHLEVRRLPQFWYYLGLHIKEDSLNVLGISTPGLPFIVMGHNGRSAWAFTVAGIDVNEYYKEKINPQDSSLYLTPTGWKKFTILHEKVDISRETRPYPLTIKISRHGPLVFKNDSLKSYYTLHWAGYDIDLNRSVSAAFDLMKVADYDAFRLAVTNMGALDASWTYADVQGNIGYELGTPVAIRPKNPHNLPLPGWTDRYEWQGFIPLDKMPHSLNPKRGWLATCNNKEDDANLDYPLYGTFAADRILRITELLKSKNRFTVKDMQTYQMDRKDDYLLRWRGIISGLLRKAGKGKQAATLEKWDGSADSKSKEAALVILFINRLRHLTFDDELGSWSKKLLLSDVETIYNNGPAYWFDDVRTKNKKESKEEIARKALRQALQIRGAKTWGDFQTLTIRHPLSVVPLLSEILPLKYGPFPWGGTKGALNASFYEEDEKHPGYFNAVVGPSWRFVIDFSDPDAATMALPSGNSGNPMSTHYMDFFEMWKNGQRWNVPLTYQKVKAKAVSSLWLTGEKKPSANAPESN